jgi:DNA-binding phage protein
LPESQAGRSVKTKTVSYDVAEQLRSSEEVKAYLDAWIVEAPDDTEGLARAYADVIRAKGAKKR